MKTAESKGTSIATAKKTSQPFFQKKAGGSFFCKCEAGQPSFFNPSSHYSVNRNGVLQTSLIIGKPDDKYEKEADKMADKVMRMPDAAGSIQRKCAHCEKEEKDKLQKKPMMQRISQIVQRTGEGGGTVSPLVVSVLQSSKGNGKPLPPQTRGWMETRFGTDFSNVKLHTDSVAVQMNKDLHAQAFTYGSDIYFNTGKYDVNSAGGKHLLAHELTHVVQQTNIFQNTKTANLLQRSCGPNEIGSPDDCVISATIPEGPRYLFRVNCDEFLRGNELDLRTDALQIQNGETIEIHGIASIEGDPLFNMHLSCARALRAKQVIEDVLRQRGISATILVFNHGPVAGDFTLNRSVVVTRTTPVPPKPAEKCGPDATAWFINQVNAAKSDPLVLAIKARLDGAERVARRHGFSAQRVTEGAVAQKVLAEESRAGSPTRTAGATSQLNAAAPGRRAFARALNAAIVPLFGAPEAIVLAAIKGAALTWKSLVGTGKIYDFKNRTETLANPVAGDCPVNCANTITLCTGTNTNCFIKDVPGNLFYAHIGRFVGWSELTLQLGSQFAQLESSSRWDPPEDTRMINFAFNLPDPLTENNLCSAIQSNPSVFDLQHCDNCSALVTARVVPATIT